jgi:glycyl-tRNA synthetase beta chain
VSANLLIELLTEELPPKALKRLGEAFAGGIVEGLKNSGLLDAASRPKTFATPRRLAVYITSVLPKAVDRPVEQKLMPLAVARKGDGGWSDALRKKLTAMGREQLADAPANSRIGSDTLAIKPDGKADSVYLRTVAVGQSLEQALSNAIENTIAKLPIPKVMSYQLADGATTVRFVRPAHGLLALHGDKVLGVGALGLTAGRITHGHRFQGTKDISLGRADEYEARLENEGHVIADFDKRKNEVAKQLSERAQELKSSLGPEADYTPLLDEVTALVEYPAVYIGEFEPDFLSVPQECLILTMRQNQKYFPLFDANGKLTNNFLIVSNMQLANSKNIVEGNQRVVRPRLADARFFFETDKKTKLADRIGKLAKITYHNKIGNQLERVERIRVLAGEIAEKIHANAIHADRAAVLAKADLVTAMVGEFPELQGIMGRYYALADGEGPEVAEAIEQHYWPRFSGDVIPTSDINACVALADKLVSLVGIFGIGEPPTGEKDPFALRRSALGLLRILVEGKVAVDLRRLIERTAELFADPSISDSSATFLRQEWDEKTKGQGGPQAFGYVSTGIVISAEIQLAVFEFVLERLRGYLRDKGYAPNEIEAVLASGPNRIDQVMPRIEAVRAFAALPEAESLAGANKRIRNILRKSESVVGPVDPALMTEEAERELHREVVEARKIVEVKYVTRQYTDSLCALARLRPPVDRFFDNVLVNADDPKVRNNRLRLLSELDRLMNKVADISKLAA